MPPTVVNAASGYGTGQLPDKEGQMYHCEVDDLYLIPTAEVPVTNIYRDVILEEKQLPIMNCAYTQCFRREAGSYGKDVRGLNRLHEFSKVELVRIDKPEHSKESHQQMLDHVEGLLQKLELPYRILRLCGGDMSFTAALCFDFEVYSEAQKRWLEVSSVSNFDTYQANRLKCRYRSVDVSGHDPGISRPVPADRRTAVLFFRLSAAVNISRKVTILKFQFLVSCDTSDQTARSAGIPAGTAGITDPGCHKTLPNRHFSIQSADQAADYPDSCDADSIREIPCTFCIRPMIKPSIWVGVISSRYVRIFDHSL